MILTLPRVITCFEILFASQITFMQLVLQRIEKVMNLPILPRQTSPAPTWDWFYSGVTAVLSLRVS